MTEIKKGYCQCGCGEKTSIAKRNFKGRGLIKGEPVNYIQYHAHKGINKGTNNHNWNGGKTVLGKGYVYIRCMGHPRANSKGYIPESWATVEKAIGRELHLGAIIHHVNGIKNDNRPGNLVVCPNEKYHRMLHVRAQALKECGRKDYRKCYYCQIYDDINKLIIQEKGAAYHRNCKSNYGRDYRIANSIKISERLKKWRQDNREKVSQKAKEKAKAKKIQREQLSQKL
jgi:hypothetical protein